KANPDSPQLPVRRRALREGKTVYMAVPRLRDERAFVRLDPGEISDGSLDEAATVSSYADHGVAVLPSDVEDVDLVVSGCVAVTREGGRLGKGEGYSDLEWAVLRELDVVSADTPVATTVHSIQVRDVDVRLEAHDVSVDVVVTPDDVLRTPSRAKPDGVDRGMLSDGDVDEMPVLRRLM
ncbi:MAG: 5-formyltetrahydrofolate cyclo-ligase, partial [Halobacteriales archaeon]